MSFPRKILLTDDEAHIRKFIGLVLKKFGDPRILEASDGAIAVQLYAQEKPDLVLLDVNMPNLDGLQALEQIKRLDPDALVVMLTGITVARQDPLTYFERYPGRFPLVHVKGLKRIPDGPPPVPFDQAIPNITDVGSYDIVDWKRIFAKSSQAGIRHYFVEHDQPASPFDSIRASATFLEQLRF